MFASLQLTANVCVVAAAARAAAASLRGVTAKSHPASAGWRAPSVPPAARAFASTTRTAATPADAGADEGAPTASPPSEMGMTQVLFVECGIGADQHGQDATKAAVRACRNAIEFNSIPSIRAVVPGGYDNMKLHIHLGVPAGHEVDLESVKAVFPYGRIVEPVRVDAGGLLAKSGIAIAEMGDVNDDFVIAVAAVTVGY
eukprot:22267-Pelagococcus_subviridis.AAC.4